ncbi:MAG: NAD(P)-dependent oxidoreductase [Acidobacteriota bacterium]|nr:NAD(P)-dependent oxidoreductase [Acidobacteriota bacterium]
MSLDRPSVAVLGAGGQLGQAIAARFGESATVHALPRGMLDITDAVAVAEAFGRIQPRMVVNCAAFNDVDGAQEQQAHAMVINGLAVGILARAAEAVGATFVHYGTDFVFAGHENRVWTEDDQPEPQSVYAQSKLVGEWLARDCSRHYVLRVESLFGGPHRRSTVDRIVTALTEGRATNLFHDRTVTPSFVDDVAEATWRLVALGAPSGVYHCANEGATTWVGLGQEIARVLGLDPSLIAPVSMAEVALKAPRPRFAALSSQKLARAGAPMPSWENALARYLSRLPV